MSRGRNPVSRGRELFRHRPVVECNHSVACASYHRDPHRLDRDPTGGPHASQLRHRLSLP